jgi:hypothetical protein
MGILGEEGAHKGPRQTTKAIWGTSEGGQAKRPKQVGQLSYARATREGIRMAFVGEAYPGIQISRQNIVDIQRAICWLVDELPEEWLIPRLVDSSWVKGAAIMVCQDETIDWLAARVPTLVAWEGSRLKMLGLDSLPTYKRVVAWFPGPVEDMELYFQWLRGLNQGLDTRLWRVYERKEEPKEVRLCSALILLLPHWRKWSGDPSVEWDKPSSPFWMLNRKGRKKRRRRLDVTR